MKSINAMVYLDDELVYDGREGKSELIEKRFDVSNKSRMEIRCYCPESQAYRGFQGAAYRCQFELWSLIAFTNENVGEIVGTSSIESLDSTGETGNGENEHSQTNPTDDTIDSGKESGDETIDSSVSQNESSGEEQNSLNIESDVSENELASSDVSSNELVFFDVSTNELEESDVSENEIDAEFFVESVEEPKNETIRFCYDRVNKNLLMTTSDDGRIQYFIYGNGLICSYEDRETEDDLAWPRFECYSYDLRGSVTTVTNERGELISEYEYSTYGNRSIICGEDSIFGYCARYDVLTDPIGFLYMRTRYYSPELMRFINQDIVTGDINNSNSLNRYTYVEGNPVTLIDPFGLSPQKNNDKGRQGNSGGVYSISSKGKDKLRESELSAGFKKYVCDDNGGIRPYYAHDGKITFGYGHAVSEREYQDDNSEGALIDEYFDVLPSFYSGLEGVKPLPVPTKVKNSKKAMPVDEAEKLFNSDVAIREEALNDFLESQNIQLSQNEYDAALIHIYKHGFTQKYKGFLTRKDRDEWTTEYTINGKIPPLYQSELKLFFDGEYE